MNYLEEIQKGMVLLNSERYTFVGQAVSYKGTGITGQIQKLHNPKTLELPVAEDFQMGFCLGMALTGDKVVSVYPRFNFLLLAANQLINHIDKWNRMNGGNPKVIVKVVVGSEHPLDPGQQHKANFSKAFELMCETVKVREILYPHQAFPFYQQALEDDVSTVLVEHADLY